MSSPKLSGLSFKQMHAVELIAQGRSLSEVASALDVARQTVSGWRNHNKAFSEAIEAAQEDIVAATRMAAIDTHRMILRSIAELSASGTHQDRRELIALYYQCAVRPQDIEKYNNPPSADDDLIAQTIGSGPYDAIN
jgi:transposase-like protein